MNRKFLTIICILCTLGRSDLQRVKSLSHRFQWHHGFEIPERELLQKPTGLLHTINLILRSWRTNQFTKSHSRYPIEQRTFKMNSQSRRV